MLFSFVAKRVCELENVGTGYTKKLLLTKASLNRKDRWLFLHYGQFACITDYHKEDFVCDVINSTMLDSLYTDPCNSNYINIYVLKRNHILKRKLVKRSEIKRKVVCLPYNRDFVLVPLVHDVC